ncbi:hypothetical protein ACCO45_003299 [Purpureocillium lilacinum]|uniref:Uncharacterized protein n=1 Tax=Purpureocillium lilacinum TaxID=33203 RepID=A0ACC4DZU6_PURLI
MSTFSRLVRFLARDGRTRRGRASSRGRLRRAPRHGPGRRHPAAAPPLAPSDVGTVRCLGLNYADHARETGMAQPKFPILFYKPATALAGPSDAIPVHAMAQEGEGLDYECELVVVISKRCTDVPESEALDCVLGYAVGNDVSHRDWQIKHGGSQWSHGKGFDGWAPYGPAIVSGRVVQDPEKLKIWTKVNGETRQDGSTSEMIFGIRKTIALLSRGVTLMPGDLIFTGTPPGVGMGHKPPVWLKDGDVVEVGLEQVGTCTNKVEFASPKSKI